MKNVTAAEANSSGQNSDQPICTAFEGHRCIASGPLKEVARKAKRVADGAKGEALLIFDDLTGEVVEIDFRGTAEEVVERLSQGDGTRDAPGESIQKRRPGRPKLGVIAREVTLLPGQWDWLDEQPGGASVALRRLVYAAKLSSQSKDGARQAQEAVYRFMTTMAGNFSGFEEALRAFYRRDHQRFGSLVAHWPKDVRHHLKKLVVLANQNQPTALPVS